MNEFEELQRIWDSQNKQSMYVVSELALHKRVMGKKNQVLRTADVSEWLLVIVNLVSGVFVFLMDYQKISTTLILRAMAMWMFFTAAYALMSRIRRIRDSKRFDRSLRGELASAIASARYQVRLSQLMRWNAFPIGAFILAGLLNSQKPMWATVMTLFLFGLAYFLGGWEHKFYQARKAELETLQSKLNQEV